MKFKVNLTQAYLYDLMQLPQMLAAEEDARNNNDLYRLALEEDPQFLKDVQTIKEALTPHEATIKRFYAADQLGSYDFAHLLQLSFPFSAAKTLDGYFETIMKTDEKTIKQALLYAILLSDEDNPDADRQALKQHALSLSNNQGERIALLKALSCDETYRWQLLMILEDPLKALEDFQALLKTIQPVFDAFYAQKQTEITTVKARLLSLMKDGLEAFFDLTNHMIPTKYFNKENNTILISIVHPYQMTIRANEADPYLIWGLQMEKGFKFLKQMQENDIVQRTQVFKLLGDKTRYETLRLLASGESSTKKIANTLNVSSATISYHINAFVTQEIIRLSPEKHRKYDINYKALDALWQAFLEDLKSKPK